MSSHETHESYYVPAQSKWPIIATLGMLFSVYGGHLSNDITPIACWLNGPLIFFFVGGLFSLTAAVRLVWQCDPRKVAPALQPGRWTARSAGGMSVYFFRSDVLCRVLRCVVLCAHLGRAMAGWRGR